MDGSRDRAGIEAAVDNFFTAVHANLN
jgi:hypothetical protein